MRNLPKQIGETERKKLLQLNHKIQKQDYFSTLEEGMHKVNQIEQVGELPHTIINLRIRPQFPNGRYFYIPNLSL